MTIQYAPKFKKQYQKLPLKFQEQCDNRIRLFMADPSDSRLRVHPLRGRYGGYWSININGDLRALYQKEGDDIIIFGLIGTHSQLYG